MNILKTFTIFLTALAGLQTTAMQQPDLRQQLITAASEGNVERVEELMLAGVPVAPEALYYPTVWGKYDVVKTIFECGVDPESSADLNQVYYRISLFEHLLQAHDTIRPQVKERLFGLYIKYGADLDRIISPITQVGPLEAGMLELLLKHGVDVNARDIFGRTALTNVAGHLIPGVFLEMEPELSVYKQLLKRSAEVLIKHGADVNLTNKVKETSLIMAARQGNRPLVELLLENGANVNLKNTAGKSALDYAKDQPEILKLLKDAQKT